MENVYQKAAITVGDLSGMLGCGVGKCFNACCFLVLLSSLLSGVRTIFLILCFTLEAEESCCLAVVFSEPFVRNSADVAFLFRQHPIEIINIIPKLTKTNYIEYLECSIIGFKGFWRSSRCGFLFFGLRLSPSTFFLICCLKIRIFLILEGPARAFRDFIQDSYLFLWSIVGFFQEWITM